MTQHLQARQLLIDVGVSESVINEITKACLIRQVSFFVVAKSIHAALKLQPLHFRKAP